jgi:4-alpha-glucanotransferase
MTLIFRLRFFTKFGQNLFLRGNREWLGGGPLPLPLQYLSEGLWQVSVPWPEHEPLDTELTYHYLLRNPDGNEESDCAAGRQLNPGRLLQAGTGQLLIIDSWNFAGLYANAFYTEPFRQVLLKPWQTEIQVQSSVAGTHRFRVRAPLLSQGQTLCLLGDGPLLGQWNTATPHLLNRQANEDCLWLDLDLRGQKLPVAYKYGVYDVDRQSFVRYEDGANRILSDAFQPGKQTLVDDGFAQLPADTWRGAGVAIPVFSLRTDKSFGIGEFADIKPLADWCQRVGLKLVQILPINDTMATQTNADSYPYSAISAFALHPIYLNLNRVATAQNQAVLQPHENERLRLNSLEKLDYMGVLRAKLVILRQLYASQAAETFGTTDYREFSAQNRHWLVSYARFSCLRDQKLSDESDGSDQSDLSDYQPSEEELGFYYFAQYHLHVQLREAAEYAHERGVILKGDIAIGVNRRGADVWQQPELYHLDMQAGAPPDAFAVKGQNWGFPTYNWARMAETGFAWWQRRFEQMSRYFDAFRIDHILGFFRIWSIPTHAVEGILGRFVPAIPVDVKEFNQRGIPLDHRRFTQPYITEAVLTEIFGREESFIKKQFLHSERFGGFTLNPEFATQRQVEQHFAGLESTERNQRLKLGLFDLISNVLLFEVEGSQGRQYHFRFAMQDTLSFRFLDADTKARLLELYHDYFFRRQDVFWKKEALHKLPALKRATNMLICGEDLGLVPDCVPDVMRGLGLLSLEIQRMPKALNLQFSQPKNAPYLSVASPSTHDMSTIRGWWREDRQTTETFYRQELGGDRLAPEHCSPALNQAVVEQHLASPAMWSVFQLQDLLGMDEELRRSNPDDERINIPADPHHYWCYRMHLPLGRLLEASDFNQRLQGLIQKHGR